MNLCLTAKGGHWGFHSARSAVDTSGLWGSGAPLGQPSPPHNAAGEKTNTREHPHRSPPFPCSSPPFSAAPPIWLCNARAPLDATGLLSEQAEAPRRPFGSEGGTLCRGSELEEAAWRTKGSPPPDCSLGTRVKSLPFMLNLHHCLPGTGSQAGRICSPPPPPAEPSVQCCNFGCRILPTSRLLSWVAAAGAATCSCSPGSPGHLGAASQAPPAAWHPGPGRPPAMLSVRLCLWLRAMASPLPAHPC